MGSPWLRAGTASAGKVELPLHLVPLRQPRCVEAEELQGFGTNGPSPRRSTGATRRRIGRSPRAGRPPSPSPPGRAAPRSGLCGASSRGVAVAGRHGHCFLARFAQGQSGTAPARRPGRGTRLRLAVRDMGRHRRAMRHPCAIVGGIRPPPATGVFSVLRVAARRRPSRAAWRYATPHLRFTTCDSAAEVLPA